MRIGVLTSSRADFGIYLPLLKKMYADTFFDVKIIAFGTHLSHLHGKTADQIVELGFKVDFEIESMLLTDSPNSISTTIGLTTIKFADFWNKSGSSFDLIFCLGDRFEMFSAVMAGVPFNIKFAHLHGGETSLGAIDNIFRHSITHASYIHFVSTQFYYNKIIDLIGSDRNIFNVGALGLDNLATLELLSIEEFEMKWGIDLSKKTILVTYHPETVAVEKNNTYTDEILRLINELKGYQFLITMPNADTNGSIVRKKLIDSLSSMSTVTMVENLGTISYFSAMKHCSFLLGNTSSGIIEAASFCKYVINIGDRQKGRIAGHNVIHTSVVFDEMMKAVRQIENSETLSGDNIYYNGGASEKIVSTLKDFFSND